MVRAGLGTPSAGSDAAGSGVCVINEELLSETPAFDPLNKNASIVSPTNSALSSPKGNNNQKQPLKVLCMSCLLHDWLPADDWLHVA